MGNEIARFKIKDADVIIRPAVGNVGMLDFDQKKRCMTGHCSNTEGGSSYQE